MASVEFIETIGGLVDEMTFGSRVHFSRQEIKTHPADVSKPSEFYPLHNDQDANDSAFDCGVPLVERISHDPVIIFEEVMEPISKIVPPVEVESPDEVEPRIDAIQQRRQLREMVLSGGMDEGVGFESDIQGVVIQPGGLPVTSPKS